MIIVISRFGFEGWIWVLIASAPDLCILFSFTVSYPTANNFSVVRGMLAFSELVETLYTKSVAI